jgi:hypothetical protein
VIEFKDPLSLWLKTLHIMEKILDKVFATEVDQIWHVLYIFNMFLTLNWDIKTVLIRLFWSLYFPWLLGLDLLLNISRVLLLMRLGGGISRVFTLGLMIVHRMSFTIIIKILWDVIIRDIFYLELLSLSLCWLDFHGSYLLNSEVSLRAELLDTVLILVEDDQVDFESTEC